jgi:hypothetical protein
MYTGGRVSLNSQDTRLIQHYELVSVYVDDILLISKNPNEMMARLGKKFRWKLKEGMTSLPRTSS